MGRADAKRASSGRAGSAARRGSAGAGLHAGHGGGHGGGGSSEPAVPKLRLSEARDANDALKLAKASPRVVFPAADRWHDPRFPAPAPSAGPTLGNAPWGEAGDAQAHHPRSLPRARRFSAASIHGDLVMVVPAGESKIPERPLTFDGDDKMLRRRSPRPVIPTVGRERRGSLVISRTLQDMLPSEDSPNPVYSPRQGTMSARLERPKPKPLSPRAAALRDAREKRRKRVVAAQRSNDGRRFRITASSGRDAWIFGTVTRRYLGSGAFSAPQVEVREVSAVSGASYGAKYSSFANHSFKRSFNPRAAAVEAARKKYAAFSASRLRKAGGDGASSAPATARTMP